ncbi:flippase [Chryseolinea lacunae]|uniref:Flippase n=1 Tax=Chryseolinea lacunae TaxID=2801331 RepID=A0ABS1KRW6_9BACT|nr:flippase [Chryseolinea lacunae]MBL0742215.1 flippase [Chryseolinea lacunae]
MFAEKMLRLVAGLFIGGYVARYLGPSQYGLLNYVISLVTLFSVIGDLGMESILVRELIRHEEKRDRILGTAFTLKIVAALLIFVLLIVLAQVTTADAKTRTLIYIVAGGTLFESFRIIEYFFQSKVWSKYLVWSQISALAIISIYRITLVLTEASLEWFAWTYTLDFFIVAVGAIFFYFRNGFSPLAWKFDFTLAKDLLKNVWPLIFASMAVSVYMKIDQVMIKWILNDEANGYYGVAVRLSEMWNFIPVAICASLFPAIVSAKQTSEYLYLNRLQWLYDLMIVISVCIAVPMTFLSGIFVRIIFGESFAAAGDLTSIYIWSGVFVFLGVASSKWIVTENLQTFRMYSYIVAAIINVLLNFVLIDYLGLNGAAIATLIAYAYASYFSLLLKRKTRPVFVQLTNSLNLWKTPRRLIRGFSNLDKVN